MKFDDYIKAEGEIRKECNLKLYWLKRDYLQANRKFNDGEFVYCILGIIKIEKAVLENFLNVLEIGYSGYRYRKVNGKLFRTKNKELATFWEYSNLKSITPE